MDLGMRGRRALVTGASAGIGFAAARALAAEGARLALVSRDEGRIGAAAARIARETDARVVPLAGDLAEAGEPERLVAAAAAALGGLEILVANTGGPPPGRFEDLAPEEFSRAVDGILRSAERLARSALPHLRAGGWGRIVFLTSIAAREPQPDLALSNCLRPAVHGLAKTLAREVAAAGLTVNCVCPGYTGTERLEELAAALSRRRGVPVAKIREEWDAGVPRGRIGRPEEIGAVVAFLCSEPASYVNGVSLPVDGGQGRSLL